MSRDRKKPLKPWEVLGIGKTTYYAWMHNGRIPVTEGVKLRKEKKRTFFWAEIHQQPRETGADTAEIRKRNSAWRNREVDGFTLA